MPGPDIFLSYNREDAETAKRFADAFAREGLDVWWDGLLEGGDPFAHTTEQALETAGAVVVLWSARSIQSHWVRDEATRGRDRGCLVPVSIDGTEPPLGFRQIQFIDMTKWRGEAESPEFARLVKAVRSAAGSPRAQLSFIVGAPGARGLNRRRALAIGGGAVALLGGGLAAWKAGLLGGAATKNSVAVLPFRNLSGDHAQDYFSEGLAAEIRNALSRNAALKVAAEKSSQAASESKEDARKIARRLDVAFLLSGDVRLAGKALRASIDLVDGSSGFSRLSRTFERPMGDALTMQLEIADAVTLALTNEIGSIGNNRQTGGTANATAFDNYLRGRDLYAKAPDRKGEEAALARFEAAIAIDPRFAGAHAARARSLIAIGNQYGSVEECRLLYASAAKSAAEAVRLAPDFAEAQSTLGLVLSQGLLKVREARAPYRRSFELGGGEAPVLGRYALFAANIGESDKALAAIGRALELDPINPLVRRGKGYILYFAGRYREAIAPIEAALELNREMSFAHSVIGDARFMLGDFSGARAAYAREPNPMLGLTGLAIAEFRLGNAAAAQTARKRIATGLGSNALTYYQQAQIAAQWGEPENAMSALNSAYESLDSGLLAAARDPLLEPLRGRPDYLQLLSRLGLA